MLIICLRGGLGNQLFQYAAGKALASELRCRVGINDWIYRKGGKLSARRGYTAGSPHARERADLLKFTARITKRFSFQWLPEVNLPEVLSGHVLVDATGKPLAEIARLGPNLVLRGEFGHDGDYLQSEKFREVLRREIAPKVELSSEAYLSVLQKIRSHPNPVAVHVRRGDYAKLTEVFVPLGRDYYGRALAAMTDRHRDATFFIFTDDVDAVRREALFPDTAIFVDTGDVVSDFMLARACRHSITANSTFSWWFAYLRDSAEGMTVSPEQYFSSSEHQRQHVIMRSKSDPKDWLYM